MRSMRFLGKAQKAVYMTNFRVSERFLQDFGGLNF